MQMIEYLMYNYKHIYFIVFATTQFFLSPI